MKSTEGGNGKSTMICRVLSFAYQQFPSLLGFRMEEFGSSGSAGTSFSNELPAFPPQREACKEIAPEAELSSNISFCESPRDRPDPVKE